MKTMKPRYCIGGSEKETREGAALDMSIGIVPRIFAVPRRLLFSQKIVTSKMSILDAHIKSLAFFTLNIIYLVRKIFNSHRI